MFESREKCDFVQIHSAVVMTQRDPEFQLSCSKHTVRPHQAVPISFRLDVSFSGRQLFNNKHNSHLVDFFLASIGFSLDHDLDKHSEGSG